MKINNQTPATSLERAPSITELERAVLSALWESSDGNGHDFGLVEDCRAACEPQQLGGVIASLSKKGFIIVHEVVTTQSGRWTQTQWANSWSPEKVKTLLGTAPTQGQEPVVQTAASASLDGPVTPEVTTRINSALRLALRDDIMDGFCFLAPGRMMPLKEAPQFQVWKDKDGAFGVNGSNTHRRSKDLKGAGQFAVDCADWLIDQMGPFEKDDVAILVASAHTSKLFLEANGYTRGTGVMAGVDSESIWDHPTLPSVLVAVRYGNQRVVIG